MKYLRTILSYCCLFPSEIHRLLFSVLFLLSYSLLNAQTIAVAEYFFDTDPGAGNGSPLVIATPGDPVTFSSTISTAGLTGGRHHLYIRTRTSGGRWSLYEPREFFVQTPIATAEYFFDTDPGAGSGAPIPITTLDDFTFNTSLPVGGLAAGRHYLYVRTKDETGAWSLYEPREFFIQAPIALAEYFFDTDPGVGSATLIPITTVDDYTFTTSLPVGGLPDGDHYLYVRAKDETGAWSLYEPTLFTVSSVVPVGLTTFSARRNGPAVDLSWATASETNSDYFAVERWIPDGSSSENSFVMIDRVKGSGTSSTAHRYQFSDRPADHLQTIYYRLRQVDFDGKSTYSQAVAVLFDPLGTIIKVYPNPGSAWFTLEVEGNGASSVVVEMLDASGRQLESHEVASAPLVFGKDWTAGVYLVRIRKQDEDLVVKVVKE